MDHAMMRATCCSKPEHGPPVPRFPGKNIVRCRWVFWPTLEDIILEGFQLSGPSVRALKNSLSHDGSPIISCNSISLGLGF